MEITGTTGISGTIGKIRKLCGNPVEQTAIAIRKHLSVLKFYIQKQFFPLKNEASFKTLMQYAYLSGLG
jgi:hypothetical protein